ncbi:MAG: response regulator transcription factor [Dehalococcoidales bacterium]|nr:MAG: response regulator transcription factor [Dehalococcoidales bacterium]
MEKIRILLADDHAIVREGTRRVLEAESDMEVVAEAGDGEEAVEQVIRLKPDVAIMDIAMPKLNGIEATRRLKEAVPSTAVLVLTVYDNDRYVFSLLEAGAAGYLLKNVRGSELVEAIRSVYHGESVLHPAIASKVLRRFMPSKQGAGQVAPASLTERELEVLMLAAKGLSNGDIADKLYLSVRTVQGHLARIFDKLGVGSRTEAILRGLKEGWFSLEDIS